jgi:phosphoribosylanthranilate isomerase
MSGLVKICGVTDASGMEAALSCGADIVGFVFRKASVRYVNFELAAKLSQTARARVRIAAVVVDPSDDFLRELVKKVNPDIMQLHGAETPQRASEIASAFARPVFKALGIAQKEDLRALAAYAPLCEMLLLEARTPEGLASGGTGRAFDWQLLSGLERRDHILLAGGLNPENITQAIATSGVRAVDVSSGVESAPGIKDKDKVCRFILAARKAFGNKNMQDITLTA